MFCRVWLKQCMFLCIFCQTGAKNIYATITNLLTWCYTGIAEIRVATITLQIVGEFVYT